MFVNVVWNHEENHRNMSSKIKNKWQRCTRIKLIKRQQWTKKGNSTKKARLRESLTKKWKQNNAWPAHYKCRETADWWRRYVLIPVKGIFESGNLKWNNASTRSGITNKTSSKKILRKRNR